ESIKSHTSNYKINLLCLDDNIYNLVKNNCNEVVCHNIKDILNTDKELKKSQNNKPSFESLNVCRGNEKDAKNLQFIWSLAAYYSWYCLKYSNTEDITYVDADICFFQDPTRIMDLKDFGSIGLIENRVPYNPVNGLYNVGIVYFKNDNDGFSCANFWKDCLLHDDNKYANEYGTCGDQKYLELFPKLYNNVFQIDDYLGHLAPWNIYHHQYIGNKILWNGKIQDVLFYHFSNFKEDLKNKTYIPAPRHGILDLKNNNFLFSLHEKYFKIMEELNENIIWNDCI
ncbi:MAG TPA: hypothetical protein DCM40_46125, partial [Maribacter sp.]|nr:hypothetical protein [Maribacter sp.]